MPAPRLLLLLLLLPPGAPGQGGGGPRDLWEQLREHLPERLREHLPERLREHLREHLPERLREHLRAAGAVSRRYWALLSCQVWPDTCQDPEAARSGWNLPQLAQQYLDRLTTWYCSFQDTCENQDYTVSNDFPGLASDLSGRLHGQHLAAELVPKAVRGYLEAPRPGRALALAFHGWSGTGKNFAARLLAERLFGGPRSACVRTFIATFHFPHAARLARYKEQLAGQIQGTQRRCRQSLLIFDEAEKLHPGLLELLAPHLEPRAPEGQDEPPRTIFLFLSNLGGDIINEVVLKLLKAGRSREEITREHVEPHLRAELARSTESSFGQSRLVKDSLVDFLVPFLPLEYRHVRLCVRDAFESQELLYTEAALDEIAKTMTYVPREEQLFSSQGCKSVSQRINYVLP